jgi:coiled-coil domain-containing protein 130
MQGFNMGRYVPPDLEGTVGFNAASGKGHALGNRARKLKTEGILTVRFECPFAIWCTHCQPEQIIGQGVRFNAEKKKVGHYYSTPIWSFRLKHPVCGGWIEVRTDPQNAEYVVVEGGRRRDTGADKVLDGEIRLGVSEEDKDRLERDGGFGALEKKVTDKDLFDGQKQRLNALLKASDKDWADPYERSRKLRAEFRVGRRRRQADQKTGDALKDRFGLTDDLEMLSERPEDGERAKLIDFGANEEASSSSSRPMFFRHDLSPPGGLPLRSKLSSKTNQKQILQTQVAGNTRLATDPFMREAQAWKPTAKRKRQEEGYEPQQEPQKAAKMDGAVALVGYESDSS